MPASGTGKWLEKTNPAVMSPAVPCAGRRRNLLQEGNMRRLLFVFLLCLLATSVCAAQKPLIEVPLGDAPVRGPASAAVTMVEFIDFQ